MSDPITDLCPTPPGVSDTDELHDRTYAVRVFRKDASTIVVRGALRDRKPPRLYIPEDDEAMTVHHMIVDLEVTFPDLLITRAEVVMEVFPHEPCPSITQHYAQLVGLSVARGYTHKVRELFGGPRGCSHITALLQAMGPAIFQGMWSMYQANEPDFSRLPDRTPEEKAALMAKNANSCHVWGPDSDYLQLIGTGQVDGTPITFTSRRAELGLS
jgi:hypothetical protein